MGSGTLLQNPLGQVVWQLAVSPSDAVSSRTFAVGLLKLSAVVDPSAASPPAAWLPAAEGPASPAAVPSAADVAAVEVPVSRLFLHGSVNPSSLGDAAGREGHGLWNQKAVLLLSLKYLMHLYMRLVYNVHGGDVFEKWRGREN